MEIRKMAAEDLTAVAQLEATAPDAWSAAQLAEELDCPAACCLVACNGKAICGFCTAQAVLDEASLNAVTVAPACRRQGVASRLLMALLDMLAQRGVKALFLEVRAQNDAARALYQALGFVQTGVRKNFYTSPQEDAVLMKKEL